MKEKITEFLSTFIVALSIVFSLLVGVILFSVLVTAIVQLLPGIALLILGFSAALAWSIAIYHQDTYPELDNSFRWHIVHCGDSLTWDDVTLEFDTKESAELFLNQLIKYVDNDYFGSYVAKSFHCQPSLNATYLMPVYDAEKDETYLAPKEEV